MLDKAMQAPVSDYVWLLVPALPVVITFKAALSASFSTLMEAQLDAKRLDTQPVDSDCWSWQTAEGKPYLTCDLLSPLPHGFFTRHFYPAAPEALTSLLIEGASSYRLKQVHSADVLTPEEIDEAIAQGLPNLPDGTQASFPLGDGVISSQPNQAVWACSADCTPALIADVVTGQAAAVHAGWRGTAQKILPAAIERFKDRGSELKNLRVALGPAIEGAVYQVGVDVAAQVGLSVVDGAVARSTEALIAHLKAIENPPLLSDPQPERVRLDVRRINEMQLLQMGLEKPQIAIAPHCTYQDPDNFFSYRRTHEKKVQWSGIVSRS